MSSVNMSCMFAVSTQYNVRMFAVRNKDVQAYVHTEHTVHRTSILRTAWINLNPMADIGLNPVSDMGLNPVSHVV